MKTETELERLAKYDIYYPVDENGIPAKGATKIKCINHEDADIMKVPTTEWAELGGKPITNKEQAKRYAKHIHGVSTGEIKFSKTKRRIVSKPVYRRRKVNPDKIYMHSMLGESNHCSTAECHTNTPSKCGNGRESGINNFDYFGD